MPLMEWIFIVIMIASLVIGTGLYVWGVGSFSSHRNGKRPLDPEQLHRDMLADAKSEEELVYLQELGELDLHRKHLIC